MQSSRPHNRRLVLDAVRLHGPLSRTDLARRTGLTNQTASNLVELLLAEGLILEAGRRAPTRGQPARDLVLKADGALAAGFHLDRGSWSWSVSDLTGRLLGRESGTFAEGTRPDTLVPLWRSTWAHLRGQWGPEAPFCGVGVAGPGPQEDGVLRSPPEFPGWDGVDLGALAEAVTGLPARVENDARAAAVGELWSGWGRTHPDFLYLYCSWGFGLGVVLEGALRRGGGKAGEIADLYPWTVGADPEWGARADQLGDLLGVLVRALDVGAVVVGGPLAPAGRQGLATRLGALWPGVPVLVSPLDDAAAVGAAALVLTQRFEGE